ncbi:MAG TPA: hypothetical protein VFW71_07715 [Actinomycetota bacterium]|nr:hypothetical protein [Actinomycetota bacterium]
MPPGIPPLYPMGVGQIVDASIKLYRQHWRMLIRIVAIPLAVLEFLRALLLQHYVTTGVSLSPFTPQTSNSTAANLGPVLSITFAFILIQYIVVTPFLTAAVARASADLYLNRPVSVRDIYRAAMKRFWPILGALILVGLASLGGFFLLIVPGIIFAVRLVIAPVPVILEGAGPGRALRRSWNLSRGNFWRMVGLGLLVGILEEIVAGIVSIIPGIVAHFAGPVGWVISGAGAAAGVILVTPFHTIALVLLYFDLRIRKEGFDLTILAQQLGG